MWSSICSVPTSRIGLWSWIWSKGHFGLGRKWLVTFNVRKTELVSFEPSTNTFAIDMKINGAVCEETSSWKILGLTFSSRWHWGSYIISIAKTTSKIIGPLIRSMKLLTPEVVLCSLNLPYLHAENTVVISGLVPLVATWSCWISYKNAYAGLLVLHVLCLTCTLASLLNFL